MIKDTSRQDNIKQKMGLSTQVKRRFPLVFSLLALSLLIAGFAYPSIDQWRNSSLSINSERLRFATVERGQFVRDISVQGHIVAATRPMLFSPEDGRVTLRVRSGDPVFTGDVLVEVDSPGLINEFQREQSKFLELTTALARQEIETRMEQLTQKDTVALKEMELVAAKRELRRAEVAHKNSAIALQDYEKAVDDKFRAVAVFKHHLEESLLKSERLKLELDILNHALDRQKLLVQDLERKVQALTIHSPVDGVVGNLEVEQKSIVSQHQAILSVVDMSAYEIEAQVPEAYADDLAQGLSVDIEFSGKRVAGELSAISPEIEKGQVRCRIRFADTKGLSLRQNQRVNARILLESRDKVLMVARGPFIQSSGVGFVYMVEGGVAVRSPVTTGVTSVGKVEILSGLVEGQQIVISSSDVFESHERVLLLNQ